MDHRQQYLPSDPNFLLKYLDEMPSDDDSDDDFDGYISEDKSILADSSTLSSSSSSSSNSSSTLTNQFTHNSSSRSSLPSLAISGGPLHKILPVIIVVALLRHPVDLNTLISHFGTYM